MKIQHIVLLFAPVEDWGGLEAWHFGATGVTPLGSPGFLCTAGLLHEVPACFSRSAL